MIDKQTILENYVSFPNDKILKIAGFEAKGLTNETAEILINEINRRGLDPELIQWIKAKRRVLSNSEYKQIMSQISSSRCSICNSNSQLFGFSLTTITSFFIDELIETKDYITCRSCEKELKRKSLLHTSTLGWWSILGLLSTPFILGKKLLSSMKREAINNQVFEKFINLNIAEITIGNDSPNVIQELLTPFNKKI